MNSLVSLKNVSKYFVKDIDRARLISFKHLFLSANWESYESPYIHRALTNIDFELNYQDKVLILGASSSGKSTLASIICGIKAPSQGTAMKRAIVRNFNIKVKVQRPLLTLEQYTKSLISFLSCPPEKSQYFCDYILERCELDVLRQVKLKDIPPIDLLKVNEAAHVFVPADVFVFDGYWGTHFVKEVWEIIETKPSVSFDHGTRNKPDFSTCNRCFVLHEGRFIFEGPVAAGKRMVKLLRDFDSIPFDAERVNHSHKMLEELLVKGARMTDKDLNLLIRKGSGLVRLTDCRFVTGDGPDVPVMTGQDVTFELEYRSTQHLTREHLVSLVFIIEDEDGHRLLSAPTEVRNYQFSSLGQKGIFRVKIERLPLLPGNYNIVCSLHVDGELSDKITNEYPLEVKDGNFYGTGKLPLASYGRVLVDFEWNHKTIDT